MNFSAFDVYSSAYNPVNMSIEQFFLFLPSSMGRARKWNQIRTNIFQHSRNTKKLLSWISGAYVSLATAARSWSMPQWLVATLMMSGIKYTQNC